MKRVVVIGAGVAGLCCARELQRRGVHPIVIDSGPPGGGCSAGNAGLDHAVALRAAAGAGHELVGVVRASPPRQPALHPPARGAGPGVVAVALPP